MLQAWIYTLELAEGIFAFVVMFGILILAALAVTLPLHWMHSAWKKRRNA